MASATKQLVEFSEPTSVTMPLRTLEFPPGSASGSSEHSADGIPEALPPVDGHGRDRHGNASHVVGRHSRAIRILGCLQAGPGFNARELAQRMRVSRRTIYRDVSLIRDAGIPIEFDFETSTYSLHGKQAQSVPTPRLAPDDLAKLAISVQLSELSGCSSDFDFSIRESLSRLLGDYPPDVRGPIRRILNSCRVAPLRREHSPAAHRLLEAVLAAIGRRRQVTLEVEDEMGATRRTRFSPYWVEVDTGEWRFTGRSSAHRGVRSFSLRQVRGAHLTEEAYRIPAGFRTRRRGGQRR